MNGACEYCISRPWTKEHGFGRTHIQLCDSCFEVYEAVIKEEERIADQIAKEEEEK